MRKILCSLLLTILSVCYAYAQTTVTGVVKDDTGESLPGATVSIKGTTTGTITDINGKFSLKVSNPANTILKISYIGMKVQEIALKGRTAGIAVKLESDSRQLQEVVAIGYGTMKKRDLTGSLASMNKEVLQNIPVNNVAEAISGRMAGVQVTTSEGSPDAAITIRVRGGGSITQDNSPLYVVDGFQVSSINDIPSSDIESIEILKDASTTAIYGARGANGVVMITTKRGKEGKVTVNVNSYVGIKKLPSELNALSPYEYVMYQYELDPHTTTISSAEKYYGLYKDLEIYKSDKGTDWQKAIFGRTGLQQNYSVSVSGGSKLGRFSVGYNRNDEKSIMIGSDFKRDNLSFKLNSEINSKLSFDFTGRISNTTVNGAGVNTGAGASSMLRNAVKYAPTKGLSGFDTSLEEENNLNSPESASLLYNPVQSVNDSYKQQRKLLSNLLGAMNLKLIKGLTFRSEYGVENQRNSTDQVWGETTSDARSYGGQSIAQIDSYDGLSYRISNTLTYSTKNILLQKDDLTALIGQEYVNESGHSTTILERYFPLGMTRQEILANISMGGGNSIIVPSTYINEPNIISSYFGRLQYSLLDRYLFQATVRQDQSSKFAPGHQIGVFPSASFAWRASEEGFLKGQADWLSNLKLRLSWGEAGNNRIPSGLWKNIYSIDTGKGYYMGESSLNTALIPSNTLYNPDLKWETTITRNVGLDFGVLNNRLSTTIDLYANTTKDLLVLYALEGSSGYTGQYRNIGQTSNKGIEISIDGQIIKSMDFSLSGNFNIAFNKNTVDKFTVGVDDTGKPIRYKAYTSGWNGTAQPLEDYIVQEGQPVGQMYGYVTEGMYSFDDFTYNNTTQKWDIKPGVASNQDITSSTSGSYFGPGALKFKDISGPNGTPDGKIDSFDKTVIGNAFPIHTGGFSLNAKYKNFDLGVFFNWKYGNKVYNANKLDFTAQLLSRKYQNLTSEMSLSNRFTTIDPETGLNIYSGKYADPTKLQELNKNATIWMPLMTQTPLHSWAIEDGSFLRLNNITVGYALSKKLLKKFSIESLRVYATASNLHVWTKYTGFDPEVDSRRSTPLTPGVDFSAYPKSISLVGGFNLSF